MSRWGWLMTVRFCVLGPVSALAAGRTVDLGHARQRAVLAVLLLAANQPVSADQLLERVWGDNPPKQGREVVYSYLSRLRVAVAGMAGAAAIRRGRGGYTLVVDQGNVDVHRFRQLAARARAATADQALKLFDEALGLWQDNAFADLDSDWLDAMRLSLDAERRAVELDRTDAALRCGQHAELLADLTRQSAEHPMDERLAGQLMLALYRTGRQADALTTYQRLREELAEQLGTDPSPTLQQLHQQILTADPGLVVPTRSAGTSAPTPRQLPPAPAGFAGRTHELTVLTTALDITADAPTVLISALAGAGGIGKTWLAVHWAHTHADRFPDGQLFVDLRGFSPDSEPLDPLTAMRGFLDALGVDPARLSGGLDEHTARYRSQIAGKRMLIVLDNAATSDQVIPLLPGCPSCTVLVTSRTILTPLITRHSARHVNVDVLTDAEAHDLLAHRLGHTRVAAERDAVTELIQLCGRYPLALTIVASHAQVHLDLPLAEFIAELRESGVNALDDADPTASLSAVLSWSLRGLTDQQRAVFALLGIAPGPDIGLPAAASLTGLDLPEARRVLRTLVEVSLLHRGAHERYAMHDLICGYAATTANTALPDGVREAALTRVMDFSLHTAHTADRLLDPHRTYLRPGPPAADVHPLPLPLPDAAAAMAWLEAEHATLLATQRTAVTLGRHHLVWHLAWNLETFHLRRGRRHDALAAWRAALDAAAHLPESVTRIRAHRLLGSACSRLGLHEEAIGHLDRALALAVHQCDLTERANAHWLLASAWERQDDDRRALEHARHALDLYRRLGQTVWEADALNAVGWFAARLGEFDTARDHCCAALTLYRHHPYPTGQAATLNSLGFIAHRTGDHRRAHDLYDQALALYRLIGDATEIADNLDRLGHLHAALSEHEPAQAVWWEALELYQQQGRDVDAARVQRQLDDVAKHFDPQ
jgi:DNA-binding SARP family transcriptional activator/Tfp pilus assembly protein PilF